MIFPEKLYTLKNDSTVHLWLIDLRKSFDFDMSVFQEEELRRADRYKFLETRSTFLTCRYALKKLLAWYLKENPQNIKFTYNEHGKPYLDKDFLPTPFQFNVTHSGKMGCIAISTTSKLGVDVEEIASNDLLQNQDIFMSLNEMKNLESLEEDKEIALLHSWTQKEAYLKALGTGFDLPPTTIESYISSSPNLINKRIENYKINSFTYNSNIISICADKDITIEFYNFHSLRPKESLFEKN